MVSLNRTSSRRDGADRLASNRSGHVCSFESLENRTVFSASASCCAAEIEVRATSLDAEAIVYNSAQGVVYAAVVGAGGMSDRLVAIDAQTGAIGPSIDLGAIPTHKMVISDDGQFIYVVVDDHHAVQAVDTTTGTLGAKVVMPGEDQYFEMVRDLRAIPGRPNAFIVSQHLPSFSPPATGTVVYENGVALPNRLGNGLGIGGPDIICVDETGLHGYGYENTISSFGLVKFDIDETGVTFSHDYRDSIITGYHIGEIRVVGDLLFTDQGHIVNLATSQPAGSFLGGQNFVISAAEDRFYSVTDTGTTHTIRIYSLSTLELLDSFDVTNIAGETRDLVRVGDDGLVFRTTANEIVFVRSCRIADSVAVPPQLTAQAVIGKENRDIPLVIQAELVDTDGSEKLTILISGVPEGAKLSAGKHVGGGVWKLTPEQLAGLSIRPKLNDDSNFNLTVTARATVSANGDTAETTITLRVYVASVKYEADDVLVLGADAGARPRVKLIDVQTGDTLTQFNAYSANFRGGVRVALADLTGDGEVEVITAPGAGHSALVKVFNLSGKELTQYRIRAYESSFQNGVFIAAGDVNGDGQKDIITAPGRGRLTEVRTWNLRGYSSSDPFANTPSSRLLPFGATYLKGATVAAGNFDRDRSDEIVVGSGPGARPLVRVFDTGSSSAGMASMRPLLEIHPFRSSDRGGVFVAVGNVRGNSAPEIIVGNGANGRSRVEMFTAQGARFQSFAAYGEDDTSPVHVAAKNIHGRPAQEIVTSQGLGSKQRWRVWDANANRIDDVLESDIDFANGFFVA